MEPMSFQIGVAVALAFMIVDKIMYWVSKRRGNGRQPMSREEFTMLEMQIKDLHEWHNMVDSDGVKVWYVKRSLESAIEKMTEAINTLSIATKTQQIFLEKIIDRLDRA